ncbi:uncharacterized protein LOC124156828 [Ischnura elegans]|uniref:uncharacterized protein LOC124156828 n=1 Tax=Ischnura elegans TaxID=197161 RepID=UPI001ED8680C|nr:uncharacterized protein LOC124156828 [Ischnura elegans]
MRPRIEHFSRLRKYQLASARIRNSWCGCCENGKRHQFSLKMETVYIKIEGRDDVEEFILSPEDSQRARNDPQFLRMLLQSRFGGSSNQEDLESKENLGCSWSHEDTLLLLEVYREKEGAFSSQRLPRCGRK